MNAPTLWSVAEAAAAGAGGAEAPVCRWPEQALARARCSAHARRPRAQGRPRSSFGPELAFQQDFMKIPVEDFHEDSRYENLQALLPRSQVTGLFSRDPEMSKCQENI